MLNDEERERLYILEEIVGSEQFMWLMVGSNHVEGQLSSIREYWQEHHDKLPHWGREGNRLSES